MAESQVLIDALPYTDEGYEDEKVRESAARLIEEEVCMFLHCNTCLGLRDKSIIHFMIN